jgi:hypothetical protein
MAQSWISLAALAERNRHLEAATTGAMMAMVLQSAGRQVDFGAPHVPPAALAAEFAATTAINLLPVDAILAKLLAACAHTFSVAQSSACR